MRPIVFLCQKLGDVFFLTPSVSFFSIVSLMDLHFESIGTCLFYIRSFRSIIQMKIASKESFNLLQNPRIPNFSLICQADLELFPKVVSGMSVMKACISVRLFCCSGPLEVLPGPRQVRRPSAQRRVPCSHQFFFRLAQARSAGSLFGPKSSGAFYDARKL